MDSTLAAHLGLTVWPELIHDRPAIVYPQPPGHTTLPVLRTDGWSSQHEPDGWATPHADWAAVFNAREQRLAVTRPGGLPWFTGLLPAAREWRRAARNHQAVLQITGPFAHPGQFRAAAAAGLLHLVVVAFRFDGSTW